MYHRAIIIRVRVTAVMTVVRMPRMKTTAKPFTGPEPRKNRIRAAIAMVERHDGEVPGSHSDLLDLPGVGLYTAAAVASFAFEDPQVVIDTNVRRVLVRTLDGQAQAARSLTAHEARLAASAMPARAWPMRPTA